MLVSIVNSCRFPHFIHEDGDINAPYCSVYHNPLPRVEDNLMGTVMDRV